MNEKNQTSNDVVFNASKLPHIHFFKEDICFFLCLYLTSYFFYQRCSLFHLDTFSVFMQLLVIIACFLYIIDCLIKCN